MRQKRREQGKESEKRDRQMLSRKEERREIRKKYERKKKRKKGIIQGFMKDYFHKSPQLYGIITWHPLVLEIHPLESIK